MYKSLIDGHECTERHYLVEIVMMRKAKKLGVTLPSKFWNTDEWKKDYKRQIIAANSLLKIFSTPEILDGLRSKEGNWIYSLSYPGLVDIIDKCKSKQTNTIKSNNNYVPVITQDDDKTVVKPSTQKRQNIAGILGDIDSDLQGLGF